MRPIVASISHSALRHNLAVVKQLAPRSKVMAVVKANAYGHGLLNVAQGLAAADGFAVLGMSEAVMLRSAGFKQTLLLLEGVCCADELQVCFCRDKLSLCLSFYVLFWSWCCCSSCGGWRRACGRRRSLQLEAERSLR